MIERKKEKEKKAKQDKDLKQKYGFGFLDASSSEDDDVIPPFFSGYFTYRKTSSVLSDSSQIIYFLTTMSL